MAVYMNNTPVKEIWWNGTKAKKVYYNNVLVLSSTFASTYTGAYATEGDLGGNFVIRFKTSGTLTITDTGGAGSLDVFLVGGGGGSPVPGNVCRSAGGGGGYTGTHSNVAIAAGTYQVVVGAGGAGVDGGSTSIFQLSAAGGKAGSRGKPRNGIAGGDGGSGGGSVDLSAGGNGGSDGSDGGSGDYTAGGKGQGSTTREFGTGTLYSGGGAGYAGENWYGSGGAGGGGGPATNGTANTGGGGGAPIDQTDSSKFTTGGSGIVCIRNHR